MAPRRKTIVDLVRDASFKARYDELLLAGDEPLLFPALEDFRQRFRASGRDREVSLELERALKEPGAQRLLFGDLQQELLKLGPAGSFEQLQRFAPAFFRHRQGALAGQPYAFPPNHEAFLREFWRRDKHGNRVYQVGLLMEPKGCSKTPTAAVLGTHALVSEVDAPSVYQISGAKKQANYGHRFASWNVHNGRLGAWVSLGGGSLFCREHDGEFEILSAEGDFSAGSFPIAAIYDELFLFRHRSQREAWHSQTEALHKGAGRAWVLGISTAGYDKHTLLGEYYDGALAHPKLEVHDGGFHLVLRDTDAKFLFWCHEMPLDADFEDPAVVRRATPAPWIDPQDVLSLLYLPNADENAWLRLHGNRWTRGRSSWLPSGIWARLKGETQIPDGAEILVGIDAARSWDTTAVTICWVAPSGRKVLRTFVWSVRPEAPHHEFVEGGQLVNEELVEPYVHALADRYRIRAIAFDPKYFVTEAKHLADAGHVTVEIQPGSQAMTNAVVLFEKDARAGLLEHDGERVLAAHIDAIDAIVKPDQSKKIGHRSEAYPIDAGIAAVLANYLTSLDDLPALGGDEPAFAWV